MKIEIPDNMIDPVLKLLDAGVRAGGLSTVEATYTMVKAMENASRIEAEERAKENAAMLAKVEEDAKTGGKAQEAVEEAAPVAEEKIPD